VVGGKKIGVITSRFPPTGVEGEEADVGPAGKWGNVPKYGVWSTKGERIPREANRSRGVYHGKNGD